MNNLNSPPGLMPSLEWWYGQMDQCIESRHKAVAMVTRVEAGQRPQGLGSGFFYRKDGWPFFVTAMHVVKCVAAASAGGVFLYTRGAQAVIPLHRTEFLCFDELDLAVSPLWRLPKEAYAHVLFLDSCDVAARLDRLAFFAFTGFPANRNKFYTGCEIKAHQRVITMAPPIFEKDSLTTPFWEFDLDGSGMHDSNLRSVSVRFPDGLSGMSGGAMFQLEGPLHRPTCRLLGLGISWLPSKRLKVLRFDWVDALLMHHLEWK